MIAGNELMIGNWVDTVSGYQWIDYLGVDATLSDGATRGYEQLEPIALTPEILEKAGFNKGGDKVWSSPKHEIELLEDNDGYSVVINREYTDGTPKKYLHELQNVSFVLYGQELEITL